MALTVTKIRAGESALGHAAIYRILFDDSFLAAGEAIDLTADFSEIHDAHFGAATVIGNHAYKFNLVIPAAGTAITSSNVLVAGYWASTSTGVFTAIPDATDLSALVEVRLTVYGKSTNPSNYQG